MALSPRYCINKLIGGDRSTESSNHHRFKTIQHLYNQLSPALGVISNWSHWAWRTPELGDNGLIFRVKCIKQMPKRYTPIPIFFYMYSIPALRVIGSNQIICLDSEWDYLIKSSLDSYTLVRIWIVTNLSESKLSLFG